ncbi:MAG: hypothetical protein ACKPKO_22340, partial [Candidatus Fonsibacter sp.]
IDHARTSLGSPQAASCIFSRDGRWCWSLVGRCSRMPDNGRRIARRPNMLMMHLVFTSQSLQSVCEM